MARQIDFLHGSIWNKVLIFALPLIASNVLQQLFNTADVAVLGRVVGDAALTAVGCTGPVVSLFIGFCTGLSVGANAIISRKLGASDAEGAHNSIHTAMSLAIIGGLLLCLLSQLLVKPILIATGAPEEHLPQSLLYLRIYFAGCFSIMIYNFEAAILRAGGDTRRPLYVLLCSGVLNVGLNLFFVIVFRMGVAGVALATTISNTLSALTLLIILLREKSALRLQLSHLRIDPKMLQAILVVGVPTAIQGMLFNISNTLLQSGINSLGDDVIAGSTIGGNLDIYNYYVLNGFGQASITFNSQNLGAGDLDRCFRSTRCCLGLGMLSTAVVSALMILLGPLFCGIFSDTQAIMETAMLRIYIVAGLGVINSIQEIMSGTLRGLGYAISPTLICILFICGLRVIWVYFIFPLDHSYLWLMMAYPVSWVFTSSAILIAYFRKKKLLRRQFSQAALA